MDRLTAGRRMAVPSFRFAPLGNSRQSISRPGTTTGLRASSAKAVLMAVTGPVTVCWQVSQRCPVACFEVAGLNGPAGISRYLFPCCRTPRSPCPSQGEGTWKADICDATEDPQRWAVATRPKHAPDAYMGRIGSVAATAEHGRLVRDASGSHGVEAPIRRAHSGGTRENTEREASGRQRCCCRL